MKFDELELLKLVDNENFKPVLDTSFLQLVSESDRGCILICTSKVESTFKKLYSKICPESMSKGNRKRLLSYPGPISSLAAMNDIGYFFEILDKEIWSSINTLRKLRNRAAHEDEEFKLNQHKEMLSELNVLHEQYNFSAGMLGVYTFLANMDTVLKINLGLIGRKEDLNEEVLLRALFMKQIDKTSQSEEIEIHMTRWKLGLSTIGICGLLHAHFDNYIEKNKSNCEDDVIVVE